MARGGKRAGKKGGRRGMRKSRVPKSLGLLKSDCAQVTVNYGEIALQANQVYGAYSFSLSNSARAKTVAQAYQFYRIRKVMVKVKPYYDTFAATGATSLSVPNLYYMIDRSYQFAGSTTVVTLKNAGAKPRRLDDKNISFSFSPSVTTVDVSAPGVSAFPPSAGTVAQQLQAGSYKISPWLPTNGNAWLTNQPWIANTIDHGGFAIGVEQANVVATTTPVCGCEFMVEFEFKKRLWENPAPTDTPVNILNLDTMTIEVPEVASKPLSGTEV